MSLGMKREAEEEEKNSFSKILVEKSPELEEEKKDSKLDVETDKTKVSSSTILKSKGSKASDIEASGEKVDANEKEPEEDDLTIDHKPEVTEMGIAIFRV